MTDASKQPPSFEPKSKGRRPSAHGARRVGTGTPAQGAASSEIPLKPPVRTGPPAPIRRSAFAQDASSRQNASTPPAYPPAYPPSSSRPNTTRTAQPEHPAQSAQPAQSEIRRNERIAESETPPAYPPAYPPASSSAGVGAGATPSSFQKPLISRTEADSTHAREGDLGTNGSGVSRKKTVKRVCWALLGTLLIVVLAVGGWCYHLYNYGNDKLQHLDALSGKADTSGTTYLLVGSDKRGAAIKDGTEGQRSDTMMLFHVPDSGNPSLISLPRDAYVSIPGHEKNKLNAAYSFGGPKLLVATVEELSGMKIDHYIEVGMDGIKNLTDAVDGIDLCYEHNINDPWSNLNWTAGCHTANGDTALAFARMRKADPLGDIGRTARQRQVVQSLLRKATSSQVLYSPSTQKALVGAAADSLTVDTNDSLLDIGKAGLNLRKVMSDDGLIGVPPIANLNYHPGRVGSAVKLDEEKLPQFWKRVESGEITKDELQPKLG
ncbi:LCP family protein required for cell wall assembly [Arcanobacterium pluranimalium]|uniref:LCP family protein n=1 Tax=Arcanobacterium pluranimalium TaxID=108028 RepID=UPI00195CCAF4|nr:LCP family protein [Arcanobacterium pluranimalium]MBM7824868.1 LCP family protein required for cell wall assembly [Arcanobacterium pluranimalium]